MTHRFGRFELDADAYELRRDGRRIRMPRQPMDLLLLLVDRRRQLVSHEEIANRLWGPGVFVDLDAGIHSAILKVRQALGDSRESSRFIESVPGKGYRFVADVDDGAPRPLDVPKLPVELTSFVGRTQELTELPRLLANARLLTLTGAGGIGKTRLAVRLAAVVAARFAQGVRLVDLEALGSPHLIAQTIAAVAGVRESANRPVRDALLDWLRNRELLLVLDTCEHLIGACAELAEAMLRVAPALRIVATSREALGVPGEIVYRVPSLSLPEQSGSPWPLATSHSDATQLFLARAAEIDPTFVANDEDVAAIGRICTRLDGIALAIELAAARIVVLSLDQIEARLHDRFRLLTGGTRTAVARQRTLEATVEWSYQLLSDDERLLLDRLSVFPASFALEGAERVCGHDGLTTADVLDLLSRLVAKSLLARQNDFDGERRYRLLETVRHYARERLTRSGQLDRWHNRHFQFVFETFRGAQTSLRGPDQVATLKRLQREQENVRAALDWGLGSASLFVESVELAGALFWFWTKRGLFEEGKTWFERTMTQAAPAHLRARALIGLAHMHDFRGHHTAARACADEALALGHQAHDPWAVSVALFLQSLTALQLGNLEQAAERAQAARTAADSGCDPVEHGGPLMVLGNVALIQSNHELAQLRYDESIDVHRRAGDAWGLAILLSIAAGLRVVRQDLGRACADASEALDLSEQLEDRRGMAWSLEVFAGLFAAAGDDAAAARLWGASDGLLEEAGGLVLPTISWIRNRYIEPSRSALGDEPFATIRAEGRAMSPGEAAAFARQRARIFQ